MLEKILQRQGVISCYLSSSNHIATPGPHAVREANGQAFCYDKFGNQVNAGDRQVVYNADNLPTQVTKGAVSYQYLYDPNGDRFYQRKQSGTDVTETFYLAGGLYEEDIEGGVTTLKSYVGDFLIDKRVGEQVTQVYTLRDHLGSVDTIVDADVSDDLQASVLERMSYEAFGERAEDTRPAGTTAPTIDDRGFTDHEHMDDVGLIHMNGRVYDPVVGRFLSPDPYVQAPYSSQSYNRYSYVWNNPLSATDPSGYEMDANFSLGDIYIPNTIDSGWLYQTIANAIQNPSNYINNIVGTFQPVASYSEVASVSGQVGTFTDYKTQSDFVKFGEFMAANGDDPEFIESVMGRDYFKERLVNTAQGMNSAISGTGNFIDEQATDWTNYIPAGMLKYASVFGIKLLPKVTKKVHPNDLIPTQPLTKSRKQMKRLSNEIDEAGEITESLKYVERDGKKYLVDGHHRQALARQKGINEVPAEKVELPYKGYKTEADLEYSQY